MELQWPLILFTTLLAWAAGLFAAQCVWALRGKGARAQMPALITSAVLLVVGGIAVFFHLEHWERIFNGFGHMTSGITQELIAIVVLAVVMVVYFVYLRRGGDEAKVPTWLSIVGIVVAAILVIVMGHSYMMASLPAWNSLLQIASLLGAACGFGPATMALICAVRDESSDLDAKANLIGQAVNVVLVVAYGLPARGVFPLLPSLNVRGITGILWECLPLFIAAFLNQYLANAPRFAIHASLGDEELGVFAIIYMPAVAINMLSLFVFRPLLTRMALRWAEGKRGEFFAIVRRGLLTTAGAFVLVAVVTYFIGAPLLTLVYSTDVSDYLPELMVLVLGGALNAAGVILYYALATMRRLRAVLVAFLIAGGTAYLAAAPLVRSFAMMGASLAYASTMALLAILFVAFMLIPVRNAPIETESVNG